MAAGANKKFKEREENDNVEENEVVARHISGSAIEREALRHEVSKLSETNDDQQS